MRARKLPLCRATALPMNSAYPRTSQAQKLPLFRATALPINRDIFPFEGVYLRHLDWLSVNIILEAKSPSACCRRLGLALNERPGLKHSFEPSFESLHHKNRLLLHINDIYEGPKITPLPGHSLAYE